MRFIALESEVETFSLEASFPFSNGGVLEGLNEKLSQNFTEKCFSKLSGG